MRDVGSWARWWSENAGTAAQWEAWGGDTPGVWGHQKDQPWNTRKMTANCSPCHVGVWGHPAQPETIQNL